MDTDKKTDKDLNTDEQKQTNEETIETEPANEGGLVLEVSQNAGTENAAPVEEDSEVAALRQQVRELEQKMAVAREKYLRLLAESDNYRKRITKEKEEYKKVANEKLIRDMLPVLDNLQRALEAAEQSGGVPQEFIDGIHMVERDFIRVLTEAGVQAADAEPGVEFDPTIHQALHRVETDEQPPGTVVRFLQKGYLYNNKLLRPALVLVAAEPEQTVPGVTMDLADLAEGKEQKDGGNDTRHEDQ